MWVRVFCFCRASRQGDGVEGDVKFRNTGWTDEARAAALAVRRAKAAARRQSSEAVAAVGRQLSAWPELSRASPYLPHYRICANAQVRRAVT